MKKRIFRTIPEGEGKRRKSGTERKKASMESLLSTLQMCHG